MRRTTGWQYSPTESALRRATLERRDLREDDIAVRVDFCGVCHSDLHAVHNLVGKPMDGLVPGHEFTGTVTETGSSATRFAPGDRVAVGTIVDSCGQCRMCRAGQENFCVEMAVTTYGGTDRRDGRPTQGGFSREYVLRETFAYRLPESLDPAAAAPLMCAGITVWEPLRSVGVGPGSTVGVVGLGGLGHLAVKLAAGLGAQVTVLSRSAAKADDAARLGADTFLVTEDESAMAGAAGQFDVLLDTVPAAHDIAPLVRTVGLDGTLFLVGAPFGEISLPWMNLVFGRKKLSSSGTGGSRHTGELLEFAARHRIGTDIEVLPSSAVGTALDRLAKGDVRYRFVLDLADLD